jgi:hypothetical protein
LYSLNLFLKDNLIMSSKLFKFLWGIIASLLYRLWLLSPSPSRVRFRSFLEKCVLRQHGLFLSRRENFSGPNAIVFVQSSLLTIFGVFLFSTVRAEIIVNYDANFPESHKVPFQYAVDIWNQLIDTTANDVEIQAKWEDLGVPTTIGRGRSETNRRNFAGLTTPPDTPYYPIPHACENDTCTSWYSHGMNVYLRALSNEPNGLVTWGGDCSGADQWQMVRMMEDKVCTVTFE